MKTGKSCPVSGKKSYRRQEEAEQALRIAQEKGRDERRVYLCHLCGFYHLSRQEKRK
jgi:hypothetical protein